MKSLQNFNMIGIEWAREFLNNNAFLSLRTLEKIGRFIAHFVLQ